MSARNPLSPNERRAFLKALRRLGESVDQFESIRIDTMSASFLSISSLVSRLMLISVRTSRYLENSLTRSRHRRRLGGGSTSATSVRGSTLSPRAHQRS
jgi:hypothetical protein